MEMMPPKTNGFVSPWTKSFGMKRSVKPSDAICSHTVRQYRRVGTPTMNGAMRLPPMMPDEVVDDREHRQHDQRREHARRDELLDRIRAERVERVDLLGDAHGAELRGDARPDATGDHQAREHRTELADHRRRDEAADVHRGAERLAAAPTTAAPAPCR